MMRRIASFLVRFLKTPTATLAVLLASLGLCARLIHTANAYTTTFNPFTGNLDYVGVSAGAQGVNTCGDSTHALGFTSTGTFTCQSITGSGSGSGIVSPGTFTWVNNFGISASTIAVSSNTILPGATFYQNAPSQITTLQLPNFTNSNFNPLATNLSGVVVSTPSHFTQLPLIVTATGTFNTTSTSFVQLTSSFNVTMIPTSSTSCFVLHGSGVINDGEVGKNHYLTVFDNGTNICNAGQCVEHYAGNAGTQLPIIAPFAFVISTCPTSAASQNFIIEGKVDSGGTLTFGDGTGMAQTLEIDNVQ